MLDPHEEVLLKTDLFTKDDTPECREVLTLSPALTEPRGDGYETRGESRGEPAPMELVKPILESGRRDWRVQGGGGDWRGQGGGGDWRGQGVGEFGKLPSPKHTAEPFAQPRRMGMRGTHVDEFPVNY